MSNLYPYQEAGVRFILGRTQVPCTGPECHICRIGNPARERVRVKVVTLNKETIDLEISRTLANKIAAIAALKPTRWQRMKNFFGRIIWLKQLSRTLTSRN